MDKRAAEQACIQARYDLLASGYSANAKSCGYQIPFRMAKTLQKEKSEPFAVLDCGSGSGLLGGAILKCWPHSRITGIDFSQAMLEQSKTDGSAQDIILHNLMHVPWPVSPASFDIVGAAATINYAADPHAFIEEMAQAVKPGGHVILSYLADQNNTEGLTDDGSKVYLWSKNEMADCFSENNLRFISDRATRSYSARGLQRMDNILMGIKS